VRFLFVDSITAMHWNEAKGSGSISGRKSFVEPPKGVAEPTLVPGVISEAIGQLASWLCLKQNDFTARPVFLFAEKIGMHEEVPMGSTVDLSAEIHRLDTETFTFSGRANVNGSVVQEIVDCSGWLMPLDQLEDPAETRRRFAALVDGGLPPDSSTGMLSKQHLSSLLTNKMIDELIDVEKGDSLSVRRKLGAGEPWYADHFPRFPVTPIVILNEMIGAATHKLLAAHDSSRNSRSDKPKSSRIIARGARDIKIKSFVRPGDECEIRIGINSESAPGPDGRREIETTADLIRAGKRLMRGTFQWEMRP